MSVERLVQDQFVAPDAEEIERALTATWEHAALETRRAGGAPVTRACMGTVVVLSGPEADHEGIASTLTEWSAEYPARSIIVCLDEAAGRAGIEASFSAACRLPESGGRQMCSEVIRLTARGQAVSHVSTTVLGLLVSDLPVTVWCAGATHGALTSVGPVLDAADHIAIDSGAFSSGYAALHWLNASSILERRAHLIDLTWVRLVPWRRLVAELFDGPRGAADLAHIVHVSLTGQPAASAGALLLAGWLSSRLGWSVRPDPRARERSVRAWTADAPSVQRVIAFREADAPGLDVALRVDGGAPAVYLVRSMPGGATLEASLTRDGVTRIPRSLHAAPPTTARLLHAAVVRTTTDDAFRQALAAALALVDALRATGLSTEDA